MMHAQVIRMGRAYRNKHHAALFIECNAAPHVGSVSAFPGGIVRPSFVSKFAWLRDQMKIPQWRAGFQIKGADLIPTGNNEAPPIDCGRDDRSRSNSSVLTERIDRPAIGRIEGIEPIARGKKQSCA